MNYSLDIITVQTQLWLNKSKSTFFLSKFIYYQRFNIRVGTSGDGSSRGEEMAAVGLPGASWANVEGCSVAEEDRTRVLVEAGGCTIFIPKTLVLQIIQSTVYLICFPPLPPLLLLQRPHRVLAGLLFHLVPSNYLRPSQWLSPPSGGVSMTPHHSLPLSLRLSMRLCTGGGTCFRYALGRWARSLSKNYPDCLGPMLKVLPWNLLP